MGDALISSSDVDNIEVNHENSIVIDSLGELKLAVNCGKLFLVDEESIVEINIKSSEYISSSNVLSKILRTSEYHYIIMLIILDDEIEDVLYLEHKYSQFPNLKKIYIGDFELVFNDLDEFVRAFDEKFISNSGVLSVKKTINNTLLLSIYNTVIAEFKISKIKNFIFTEFDRYVILSANGDYNVYLSDNFAVI